jgi:hypothetical protein
VIPVCPDDTYFFIIFNIMKLFAVVQSTKVDPKNEPFLKFPFKEVFTFKKYFLLVISCFFLINYTTLVHNHSTTGTDSNDKNDNSGLFLVISKQMHSSVLN